MDEDKTAASSDEEWAKRVLCSDEGCIGVIGPDGRCKECGLAYTGPLPIYTEPKQPEHPTSSEDEAETEEEGDTADADEEWARRTLCSDENCIGVIGPDGRCKECGLQYEA